MARDSAWKSAAVLATMNAEEEITRRVMARAGGGAGPDTDADVESAAGAGAGVGLGAGAGAGAGAGGRFGVDVGVGPEGDHLDPEPEVCCPITLMPLEGTAVVTAAGQAYSADGLRTWFLHSRKDPVTNTVLWTTNLVVEVPVAALPDVLPQLRRGAFPYMALAQPGCMAHPLDVNVALMKISEDLRVTGDDNHDHEHHHQPPPQPSSDPDFVVPPQSVRKGTDPKAWVHVFLLDTTPSLFARLGAAGSHAAGAPPWADRMLELVCTVVGHATAAGFASACVALDAMSRAAAELVKSKGQAWSCACDGLRNACLRTGNMGTQLARAFHDALGAFVSVGLELSVAIPSAHAADGPPLSAIARQQHVSACMVMLASYLCLGGTGLEPRHLRPMLVLLEGYACLARRDPSCTFDPTYSVVRIVSDVTAHLAQQLVDHPARKPAVAECVALGWRFFRHCRWVQDLPACHAAAALRVVSSVHGCSGDGESVSDDVLDLVDVLVAALDFLVAVVKANAQYSPVYDLAEWSGGINGAWAVLALQQTTHPGWWLHPAHASVCAAALNTYRPRPPSRGVAVFDLVLKVTTKRHCLQGSGAIGVNFMLCVAQAGALSGHGGLAGLPLAPVARVLAGHPGHVRCVKKGMRFMRLVAVAGCPAPADDGRVDMIKACAAAALQTFRHTKEHGIVDDALEAVLAAGGVAAEDDPSSVGGRIRAIVKDMLDQWSGPRTRRHSLLTQLLQGVVVAVMREWE